MAGVEATSSKSRGEIKTQLVARNVSSFLFTFILINKIIEIL